MVRSDNYGPSTSSLRCRRWFRQRRARCTHRWHTAEDLKQLDRELTTFATASAADEPSRVMIVKGGVTSEIVRVSEELPAELLIMGTHGRSGFNLLLLDVSHRQCWKRSEGRLEMVAGALGMPIKNRAWARFEPPSPCTPACW
jgi:hypothetical protein